MVLALLTVFYDLIFVFQHYVLYRKKSHKSMGEKDERLLMKDEEESMKK